MWCVCISKIEVTIACDGIMGCTPRICSTANGLEADSMSCRNRLNYHHTAGTRRVDCVTSSDASQGDDFIHGMQKSVFPACAHELTDTPGVVTGKDEYKDRQALTVKKKKKKRRLGCQDGAPPRALSPNDVLGADYGGSKIVSSVVQDVAPRKLKYMIG